MGFGVSLVLVAVGAILTWAVTAEVAGLDIQVVGVILMVVGLVGFVLSIAFWSSWGGPASIGRRQTAYVDDAPVVEVGAPGVLGLRSPWGQTRVWPPAALSGPGRERKLDDEERAAARRRSSTQMRPFIRRTSSRQMYRPSPVPPTPRVRSGSRR